MTLLAPAAMLVSHVDLHRRVHLSLVQTQTLERLRRMEEGGSR